MKKRKEKKPQKDIYVKPSSIHLQENQAPQVGENIFW